MFWLYRQAMAGCLPSARKAATRFEVSTKTIYRDIEFMRDRLLIPLVFVQASNCYAFTAQHKCPLCGERK
jgi:predicted DNA-binding transcriptional regulator YafY